MSINFKALSLSYKNAPLETRELVSLDQSTSKQLLNLINDYSDISEAIIISTCNRTEVYYVSPNDYFDSIIKLIGVVKGIEDHAVIAPYFVNYTKHTEAVKQLFDVSIGLEAQVVGDLQIINQVKHAYQWCADEEMAGPFIHRLMHTIFYTNKRVVQETAFRDGAASVSYAVVELIDELTNAITKPKILVLGLGEIGQDAAKNLEFIKEKEVKICNRSEEKSWALAKEIDCEVELYSNYKHAIQWADVIISSVSSDSPIITKALFEDSKVHSHKYLFDLSVPRSIEEDIEIINGLLLYNIDNIQSKASKALDRRTAAIPDVKAIITEVISEFDKWSQEMEVSPVINKLKNALEEIRQNEISRYVKNISDEESQLIEKITKGMMQKIMKLPVLQLKAACKRGEAESLIEVLNNLFNLEQQEEKVGK